ncbi:hypothetical protein PHYSODRAFT_332949 [Phytophthora sojae]|uniref:Uncharacterized protein n=1 Tax=Phytophthora sojae (strain P6497) TaxID=1094619 RepID=G4ZLL7_PHYSP|nr:hypothetical protein PHYSODRAFT_332949 [Phytophthora sojae]EGZ14592.1 hypothetical protein PHYSODRAFT_332949 [Phytophthora sojae]|eukprot:XP_009528341.1 hypothetical protein PHYSODRAFT_332949 [Phytophthora sojae]
MKVAVNTGRIDILNWMYEHGYSDQLVGVDNLEVFEWLLERNMVKWLYETFADAEDIDLFKSITRQEWEDPGEIHVMDTAAKYGHLGVIKYLHQISVLFKENDQKKRKRGGTMSGTGPTCSTAAIDLAAGNNYLQVVEWLHQNRKEGFTEQAVHLAAINGHLEMVQWLQEHRAHEFKAGTMDLAA